MSLFGSLGSTRRVAGGWIALVVIVAIAALSGVALAQESPGCGAGCYAKPKPVKSVPKAVTTPPVNPKTAPVMTPSQNAINPQAYAPPPLPPSPIYVRPPDEALSAAPVEDAPVDMAAPAMGGDIQPGDSAAAHLAVSRLGLDKARNLISNLSAAVLDGCQIDGRGSRCGDIDPQMARQGQTEFFSGTFAGQARPNSSPVTRNEVAGAITTYDGIPGGIVLEGAANFTQVDGLAYDPNFNALTLDNRLVFFMRTPPRDVAALAHGIAEDARIGVSLGDTYLVYGQLDKRSDTAANLQLADNFLGDITFARSEWTQGYEFADGYTPQKEVLQHNVAVFFKVSGFEFAVDGNQIRVASSDFSVRIVPLLDQRDAEDNLQADEAAIDRGEIPAAPSANAAHIADNIAHYRRERLIEQVFDYGAVASVLRGLKAQGFDLHELAYTIDDAWHQ